jgi:hypothetical protein
VINIRLLPVNRRPLPWLTVTSEEFVATWIEYWEQPNKSINQLIVVLKPHLAMWKHYLLNPEEAICINHIGLCRLLNTNLYLALEMIKVWVNDTHMISSIEDELTLVMLEVLDRYFCPTNASPFVAEKVFATLFKKRLKDKIKSTYAKQRLAKLVRLQPKHIDSVSHTPAYPDHLLFKTNRLSEWEKHLLYYLKWYFEEEAFRIDELTHIPDRTMKRDKRTIWHSLKEIYSDKV